MQSSLLERRILASSASSRLNETQLQMDATLTGLSNELSNPLSLAAMITGGVIFKGTNLLLGRIASPLLAESGLFTRTLAQGLIKGTSLFTEVAAFRTISHRSFNIYQRDEFLNDMITFGTLKGVGRAAQGQSAPITHLLQSGGMVAAHNIGYGLGLTTRPEGTLLQQLVESEVTNIKLGMAMSVVGMAAPGISALERSLELQNQIYETRHSSPSTLSLLPSPFTPIMSAVETSREPVVQLKPTAVSEGSFNMWGEKLFEASKSSWTRPSTWRSPFRIVQDRILNEMLRDEVTKKRMIAFLDVVTNAPDASVVDLLHAYFPEGGRNSQGLLRHALNFGVASWMPERLIVWGIRFGLHGMAQRFLAGETTQAALRQARDWRNKGIQATLDVVQENVVSVAEADHYTNTVLQLIREWRNEANIPARTEGGVPVRHISVKLSGLTHRFEPLAHDWVAQDVQSRLLKIFKAAKEASDAGAPVMVNVDLEDYAVRDLSYDILWNTLNQRELDGWQDAAVVVQAYYKESAQTLQKVLENAERFGKRIQIRIVKGAYHSFEQIRSDRNGWEVPVFLTQHETDQNFRLLADMALQKHPAIHLAIGSHNLEDIAYVQARREALGIGIHEVEHQFLRGVGNHLANAVIQFGIPARFYGPFGSKANGLGYMVRRLDEVKISSAIGETHSAGSWAAYRSRRQRTNPTHRISGRTDPFINEPESDFSLAQVREGMMNALRNLRTRFPLPITPLVGSENYNRHRAFSQRNVNPGRWSEAASEIWNATTHDITWAIEAAQQGHRDWSQREQKERSETLQRAANIIHERQFEIAAYLVIEAGKPWNMALAEVHEGIDFLRSYAQDALDVSIQREALGVGVAIAPFNFPFAIALGEMAGGLSLGNAMILKPSEQTPAVGQLLVEILREAGVPPDAAQFLPGTGREVGQSLVENPDIDFVVFTGSKNTAESIMESARLHPSARHGYKVVVAETGGKNAMIVDKTADLDVAVKAILDGAFMMSGQRCSATSRVFVDEAVYDALMDRLVAGARSMIVGDPSHPETQVGPQIDQRAYDKVMSYLRLGTQWGSAHPPEVPMDDPLRASGHYIRPWIFEGSDPQGRFAQEEIFGPALAVMKVKNVREAVGLANDSPYGLTAGLISRDPRNIQYFFENIQAGNAYVNRSQVGAMVRRQPFGGVLDSGTGPKAGGTQYVARFGRPRRVPHSTISGEIFADTPNQSSQIPSNAFTVRAQSWSQSDKQQRLNLAREIMGLLAVPDTRTESALSPEQRDDLVERINKYILEADTWLDAQITLATPGEINEEVHNWNLGTGLIWDDAEKPENVISASVAALMMGNSIVIPQSPKGILTQHLLERAAQKMGTQLPIYSSPQSPAALLNDSSIQFMVAHGASANEAFRHFRAKLPGVIGFRRVIGGHMDDPDDSYYLTRFAAARTRTEETLRHGAELNLR